MVLQAEADPTRVGAVPMPVGADPTRVEANLTRVEAGLTRVEANPTRVEAGPMPETATVADTGWGWALDTVILAIMGRHITTRTTTPITTRTRILRPTILQSWLLALVSA